MKKEQIFCKSSRRLPINAVRPRQYVHKITVAFIPVSTLLDIPMNAPKGDGGFPLAHGKISQR
jgi:hypothetical protein